MTSDYTSSVPDETCGQFDIPFDLFIKNAKNITRTKVEADSPFYFAEEKVDLKDLVDTNGKAKQVPGTEKQLTEEQQRLLDSIEEDEDAFKDLD